MNMDTTDGLPWAMVNSLQGPLSKTTQDKSWIKDTETQKQIVHSEEQLSKREKFHSKSGIEPGISSWVDNDITTEEDFLV